MFRNNLSVRVFSCLVAALPLAACDPVESSVENEDEVTAEFESPAAMAEAIQALSDLDGPDVDEERRSLPVPALPIDLRADGTFAGAVVEAESTRPGGPALRGAIDDLAAGPVDGPDAESDAPARARTVFGSDDRWIFYDHNYPYSTIGRIESPRGSCTGTMVGPRHVLTASHCIQWNGDGTTGWVRFVPSQYGGEAPYGEAWATQTHFYRKTDTDNDMLIYNEEVAFDFVVLTLDRYTGYSTGWMGSQTYSTSWNNGAYWSNVGYPANLGGSICPVFQSGCSVSVTLDYCYNGSCSMMMQSLCDTGGGQSGGPLYGYWNGSPHIVGVVSAENWWTNKFAGGALIPTLIQHALTVTP